MHYLISFLQPGPETDIVVLMLRNPGHLPKVTRKQVAKACALNSFPRLLPPSQVDRPTYLPFFSG